MAKVGAQRAAELTGKSKSTIQRAMNSGKLSYELDANNRRIIDVSELDRVFGLEKQGAPKTEAPASTTVETELQRASEMIEMERMKMKVKMLEDQIHVLEERLEDMTGQRDMWQKQAQQVLLTSQYSQQQAEELKAELKERDERARANRQKMMEERMKRMQGQNQNAAQDKETSKNFHGLWQRIKGNKDKEPAASGASAPAQQKQSDATKAA